MASSAKARVSGFLIFGSSDLRSVAIRTAAALILASPMSLRCCFPASVISHPSGVLIASPLALLSAVEGFQCLGILGDSAPTAHCAEKVISRPTKLLEPLDAVGRSRVLGRVISAMDVRACIGLQMNCMPMARGGLKASKPLAARLRLPFRRNKSRQWSTAARRFPSRS
jgi:hypothetical protein